MKKILKKCLLMLIVMIMCLECTGGITFANETEKEAFIYVVSGGINPGDGTIENPFNDIENAKKMVRKIRDEKMAESVTVYLREGHYNLENTLIFTGQDSGDENFSITYAAYPGEEVILTMAERINGSRFQKVTDKNVLVKLNKSVHDKVVQVNLYDQGVSSIGEMTADGAMQDDENSCPILVVDGKMQTLARWPNSGWAYQGEFVSYNSSISAFRYTENMEDKWKDAKEAWYHGFPYYLWHDTSLPITIDTKKKEITLHGNNPYGVLPGNPYYIKNLIEELDAPGEWFADRSTGVLYVYPKNADTANSDFQYVSRTDTIIEFSGASYITLDGLIVEGTCGLGVEIKNRSHHNLITNSEFRNIGRKAIEMNSGSNNNGVTWCHLHDLCKTGINIDQTTGDFTTLEYSNNYVENCHIENYGVTSICYCAGIRCYGIGNRISHNRINGADHVGIYLNGNDNIIEYNELYDLVKLAEDMAALYCWSDYTNLGHIIRYNSFHEIYGPTDGPPRTHTAHAIYFDDSASFGTFYGNTFANMEAGIYSNGGAYHNLQNNLFINVDKFAMNIWNWCSASDASTLDANKRLMEAIARGDAVWPEHGQYNHRYRQLYWQQKYPAGKAAYDAKYPWLATHLYDDPFLPKKVTVKNNVSINAGKKTYGTDYHTSGLVEKMGNVEENYNLTSEQGPTVDAKQGIYNLSDYTEVHKVIPGFEELDVTITGPEGVKDLTVGEFNTITPMTGEKELDGTSVTFTWEDSSGADSYRLVIATDNKFENVVYDQTVRRTYETVENLRFNRQIYYWKVEAISSSYAYTGTRWNKNGVQTFRTSTSGIPSYYNYNIELDSAYNRLGNAIEGTAGGQFLPGSKAVFESKLNSIISSLNGKVSQKQVDKATNDIEVAHNEFLLNQQSEILDIGKWVADQEGWAANRGDGVAYKFDSEGNLLLEETGGPAYKMPFYVKQKMENHQIAKMRIKIGFKTGSTSEYVGLNLRTKSTQGFVWPNNKAYSVVIVRDYIELQYFDGGGHIIQVADTNKLADGKEHDVEFGALTQGDGVRLIFKIDGETIFDYLDKTGFVPETGYFSAFAWNIPLTIMKTQE